MNEFSNKKDARKAFLEKRQALTKSDIKSRSEILCKRICELDEFRNADTVLVYAPTRNEPDLTAVALEAIRLGKRVAFPICVTDSYTLDFREVSSIEELTAGAYGILEPSRNAPSVTVTEKSLCITPALAIDSDGYRLGYGKGYYDRFLSDFSGVSVCAIFSDFLCERLPRQNTDMPIDITISETGAVHRK